MPNPAVRIRSAGPQLAGQAFEEFPHALIALESDGAVATANRAAVELLQLSSNGPTTCCELFGCRSGEGPLAELCLSESVRKQGDGHVELRLDLNGPARESVWVTAAAIESGCVVIEVRRNKSVSQVGSTLTDETLYISALGPLQLERGGHAVHGGWLEQRSGEVLKFLIANRHVSAPADRIAAALWPHADPRTAGRVRYFVHQLRDALEPERRRGESSFIHHTQSGYALSRSHVRLDLEDFERRVARGVGAFSRGDTAASCQYLTEALSRYRGEFLADDPYAIWAFTERDRFRDMATRALRILVEQLLLAGDLDAANEHLRRAIELEPFDPMLQQNYVEVSVRMGRRGEARRRYAELRHRMLHDFGEELEFEFEELLDPSERQLRLD